MILTVSLLYQLDMMLNKKASNEHQSIPLEDKIIALNKAQIMLIKRKIGQSPLGLGMDSFKRRYADLQFLVVPFEELCTTANTIDRYNSYKSDLSTTSKKYLLPLDAYVLCSKGECLDHIVDVRREVQHGDIATYMRNNHYKPSYEYQETFAVISNNDFIVYTDGTFKVDKLHLSYLRYPQKIDAVGYIYFDGNVSVNQDCELPDYLEDELLDLAVRELAMGTENVPAVQFSEMKNKDNN